MELLSVPFAMKDLQEVDGSLRGEFRAALGCHSTRGYHARGGRGRRPLRSSRFVVGNPEGRHASVPCPTTDEIIRGPRLTLIVTEVCFPGDPQFPGAETRPTARLPRRLGRGLRARKPPPSSGPRRAPDAPILPAAARHRPAGATRGCGAASASSHPWEDRACGTEAKPP